MALKPHYASLLTIAVVQSTILLAAWSFYVVVRIKDPLHLPDGPAMWVHRNPTETTIIVTMIATVVHFVTLSCFTIAVKHGLRQRIAHKPISLASLSFGVAAARASFLFNRRHIGLTLIVFVTFVAFGLINSAWTAFLNPVQVTILVRMTGMELDLSSPGFDTLLGPAVGNVVDFTDWGLVPSGASPSLSSFAFMSGMSTTTTYAAGEVSLFNFNNVQYNVSTGGILPAVKPQASNTTFPPSGDPTSAMFFAGGPVPANLTSSYNITGISSTYSLNQQGFTANVSCGNYTPGGWFPVNLTTFPVHAELTTPTYNLVSNASLLDITCVPDGDQVISSLAQMFGSRDSIITISCPLWSELLTYPINNITIIHQGTGVYGFLPQTACTIFPLITRSSVAYANQIISPTLLNSTAAPLYHALLSWLAFFIYAPSSSFQSDMGNSLGDLLASAMYPDQSQVDSSQAQVLLEEFWRGVVELGGTADPLNTLNPQSLRSGFTTYLSQNQSLESDMFVPVEGWKNVTTMGWSFSDASHASVYALFPITITAILTYVAIFYSFRTAHGYDRSEQRHDSTMEEETLSGDVHERHFLLPPSAMATFDASDPVHIIVASGGEKLDHGPKDYWGQHERSIIISFHREEVAGQEDS